MFCWLISHSCSTHLQFKNKFNAELKKSDKFIIIWHPQLNIFIYITTLTEHSIPLYFFKKLIVSRIYCKMLSFSVHISNRGSFLCKTTAKNYKSLYFFVTRWWSLCQTVAFLCIQKTSGYQERRRVEQQWLGTLCLYSTRMKSWSWGV